MEYERHKASFGNDLQTFYHQTSQTFYRVHQINYIRFLPLKKKANHNSKQELQVIRNFPFSILCTTVHTITFSNCIGSFTIDANSRKFHCNLICMWSSLTDKSFYAVT